jgi:tetraacyldisaccharide 4'-kinase
MREPASWWRSRSRFTLLSPLGWIYGAIAGYRMSRPGHDAGIPVICVGNFHVGGAGKTPTVIALVALLKAYGETPVVLSRGYGGRMRGPVRVDPALHAAADVGDEPLLLAASAPVVVARNRVAGAALARRIGASVVVMDDGFQNPALRKDLSLVVIDGHRGVGNGRVFPAGPLRAPLKVQLPRTDALLVIGEGQSAASVATAVAAQGGKVFHARLQPDAADVVALRGRRVLAFAGIGDPERFFATLRASGIDVAAVRAFPDHHCYSDSELADLRAAARRENLVLVTTTKDIARLGGAAASEPAIASFAVTLAIDDEAGLLDLVLLAVGRARAAAS